MSYRRKGNGFEVRVYVGIDPATGKQKYASKMVKTEKEAKRMDADLSRQVQDNTYVPPARQTVADFLAEWLAKDAKPNTKPRTYKRYAGLVRLHLAPSIGAVRLDKLTPHHVATLLAQKQSEGMSPRSCLHLYRVLHRALVVAVRWGLVGRNICDAVEPPRADDAPMAVLDAVQVRALLAAAEGDRLHAFYLTAVMTGMRMGELCGLRWSDIDFGRAVALVAQALEKPGLTPVFSTPKNRRARPVRLPDAVVEALRKLQAEQVIERAFYGTDYADYNLVFSQPNGRPLDPHSVTRWHFKRALKKAGLPDIRFHDLRHTAATLALESGVNPKAVSTMLGHHSAGFTLQRYGHVTPAYEKEAAQRVQDAILTPRRAEDAGPEA